MALLSPRRALGVPRRALGVAGLLAVAGLGAAAVLVAVAPHGTGLIYDSYNYLLAADAYGGDGSVAGSLGGDFPPGYPAAVALVAAVGRASAEGAALFVNVAAHVALVLVVGVTLWWATRRAAVALAAAAAVAVALPTVLMASLAMSDTLFVALALGAVVAAAWAGLRRPLWPALLAGGLAGAATVVRYLGLAAVVAVAVAVLAARPRSARPGRWVAAGLTLAVGVATYLVGVPLLAGATGASRPLAWHPPGRADVTIALDAITVWWAPRAVSVGLGRAGSTVLVLAVTAVVVTTAVRVARRDPVGTPAAATVVSVSAFVVAYGLGLLATKAVLDDLIVFNDRLLLPLLPAVAVLAGLGAAWLLDRPTRWHPVAVVALAAVAAIVLVGVAHRGGRFVRDARRTGLGYAEVRWEGSPVLAAVRDLPDGTPIVTNDVGLVWFRGDQGALRVPAVIDPKTAEADGRTLAVAAEAVRQALDDGFALVWVDSGPQPGLPAEQELLRAVAALGPVTTEAYDDGRIYWSGDETAPPTPEP